MRRVLAFLAVVALLVSPVTAAAAEAACGHASATAMAGMDMPAMPMSAAPGSHTAKGDPCCDPAGKPHQPTQKNCAQECAAACAVTVALPATLDSAELAYAHAPFAATNELRVPGYDPAGLERPPKSSV